MIKGTLLAEESRISWSTRVDSNSSVQFLLPSTLLSCLLGFNHSRANSRSTFPFAKKMRVSMLFVRLKNLLRFRDFLEKKIPFRIFWRFCRYIVPRYKQYYIIDLNYELYLFHFLSIYRTKV